MRFFYSKTLSGYLFCGWLCCVLILSFITPPEMCGFRRANFQLNSRRVAIFICVDNADKCRRWEGGNKTIRKSHPDEIIKIVLCECAKRENPWKTCVCVAFIIVYTTEHFRWNQKERHFAWFTSNNISRLNQAEKSLLVIRLRCNFWDEPKPKNYIVTYSNAWLSTVERWLQLYNSNDLIPCDQSKKCWSNQSDDWLDEKKRLKSSTSWLNSLTTFVHISSIWCSLTLFGHCTFTACNEKIRKRKERVRAKNEGAQLQIDSVRRIMFVYNLNIIGRKQKKKHEFLMKDVDSKVSERNGKNCTRLQGEWE